MTKYLKVQENPASVTDLKIELYYSLGGMNYFTSRAESRGYYLSVTPVERCVSSGYTSERYTAFTGLKQLVKGVKRKSQKAEKEAENLAENLVNELIEYVCGQNGLVLQAENLTA
jgi:hypothetical protein